MQMTLLPGSASAMRAPLVRASGPLELSSVTKLSRCDQVKTKNDRTLNFPGRSELKNDVVHFAVWPKGVDAAEKNKVNTTGEKSDSARNPTSIDPRNGKGDALAPPMGIAAERENEPYPISASSVPDPSPTTSRGEELGDGVPPLVKGILVKKS
jgi:hypothetical protein